MAVTQRRWVDNFVGSLKNGCTALDTALTADAFTALPSDFTTTQAMPMVIADDSQGLFEVVLVTGHNAGTNTVTVQRGRQGTIARAWSAGAIVRVAVTRRDLVDSIAKAGGSGFAAFTDTFVGEEHVDTATGILHKQTAAQGFQGLARLMPGGLGPSSISGNAPGSNLELLAQHMTVSAVTSANGFVNGTLPAGAFPNAILGVLASPKNTPAGSDPNWSAMFAQAYTTTAATTADVRGPVLQFAVKNWDNTARGNTSVTFTALVLGI